MHVEIPVILLFLTVSEDFIIEDGVQFTGKKGGYVKSKIIVQQLFCFETRVHHNYTPIRGNIYWLSIGWLSL